MWLSRAFCHRVVSHTFLVKHTRQHSPARTAWSKVVREPCVNVRGKAVDKRTLILRYRVTSIKNFSFRADLGFDLQHLFAVSFPLFLFNDKSKGQNRATNPNIQNKTTVKLAFKPFYQSQRSFKAWIPSQMTDWV